MARVFAVVAIVATLFAPARAQDPSTRFAPSGQDSQDLEKRLRERLDKELDQDFKRLRESLMDIVRSELGAKTTAKPPDATPKNWKADGTLPKALELVTEELLKGHAGYLAGDDLEGRNAGYPGNDKACEYIADVMKKAGLVPVGDKDKDDKPTYFQHFKVFGRQTQNCIGLIEGSDPDLKKEYVVLGGHHDHVGTDDQGHWGRLGRATANDKIWNGADDNGSGTTTVLGVIKALGEGKIKCKRSIILMTFSGEEGGLLGSAFYVKHPIAPIAQHVYMLNLDMVGRNPEKPMEIHGVGSANDDVLRKVVEAALEKSGLQGKLFDKVQLVGGDSDHTSFKEANVPFTFFFSGFHADYHKPSDTSDKLAYPNMVKVAKTAAHMITTVADMEKRPVFKGGGTNDFNFDNPPPPKGRRTIGITPADVGDEEITSWKLDKDQGGIKVEKITPNSVGEKAGLHLNDVIISVCGITFGRTDPLADLRAAIGKAEAGKEADVVVIRDGKKVTLQAKWEK